MSDDWEDFVYPMGESAVTVTIRRGERLEQVLGLELLAKICVRSNEMNNQREKEIAQLENLYERSGGAA